MRLSARDTILMLGGGALAVFVTMAVILQVAIKPVTVLLPQASPSPYTLGALVEFANTLKAEGLAQLYEAILVYMDTAFFSLFGLWMIAAHLLLSPSRFRWIGVVLAVLTVYLEAREAQLLISLSGLDTPGQTMVEFGESTSPVHRVTLLKYASYLACLVSMWLLVWRRPREQA